MLSILLLLAAQQSLTFDDFSGVYRAPPASVARIPVSAACGWQPGADIFQRTNWAAEQDVLSLTMTGAVFESNRLSFQYTGAFLHHHPVVPLRRVIGPGSQCRDFFDWFGCPDPTYTFAVTGSVAAVRDPATKTWGEVRHYLHFDIGADPVVRHGTHGTFNVRPAGTDDPRLYEFTTRWNEAAGSPNSADWPCIDPTEPGWRPPITGVTSYYGIRSGAAPLGGVTTVRGQLIDGAQPTRTMDRGQVAVYQQTAPLPEQGAMTLAAYEASIRDRLELVATAAVDEDGFFAAPRVPLFRFVGDSATGHWQANLITLVISRAEVDITGLSDAVPYSPLIVPNQPVFPDDGRSPTIGLTADISFGEKRTLISRLTRISKNYATPEQVMSGHLDTIEGAPTPAQREGVRRAVWAERALWEGATSMRDVIARFAKTFGKLMADIWADLQTFKTASLKRGLDERKRLNNARGSLSADQRAQFDLANVQARTADQAYSRRIVRASDSALASATKDLFKLFAHLSKDAAIRAGVPSGIANDVADAILTAVNVLFNALIEQTVRGATQDLVKKFIEYVVAVFVPVLFDNDTAPVPTPFGPRRLSVPFPLSYTNRTLGSVQFSVSQSTNWSAADDTAYIADVTRSAQMTNAIAESGAATIRRSYLLDGANKTADIAETVFKIAARFPGLQFLEIGSKTSKAGKYLTTIADLINLELAILSTPSRVDEAVHAAYGLQPGTSGGVGEAPNGNPANANLASRFDAAHSTATAELAALDALVASDRVGSAAIAYLEDDGAFAVAMRALTQAAEHLDAQTRAGTFSSAGLAATNAVVAAFRAADRCAASELTLDDAVIALLVGSMEATWTELNDPGYLSAKNRVRAALAELDLALVALEAAVDEMVAVLAGSNTLYLPAVVVEEIEAPTLTTSPQTFTVRARLMNLGVVDVTSLRAGLTVVGDLDGDFEVQTSTTVLVGTLVADDGVVGSGPDETIVEWTVLSTHPLDDVAAPHFVIELLEGAGAPSSFVADPRHARVAVDPSLLDTDQDGLPDPWEQAHGLDTNLDDADLDFDNDGVSNRDELALGLDPSVADSDADGVSDGEEVTAGADGFRTDPLASDTDLDGTNDGADLSPLDPSSIMAPMSPPAEPVVSVSTVEVTLTPDRPVAVVDVINTGGGDLYFAAATPDATLLNVSPRAPDVAAPGTMVILSLPLDRDVEALLPLDTTVVVADVSGATRDFVTIAVHLRPEGASVDRDGGVEGSRDGGAEASRDGGIDEPARDGGLVSVRDAGSVAAPDDEAPGGCGCAASERPRGRSAWALVVALGAMFVRRRGRR